MNEIETLAAQAALRDMKRKGFFSICVIDHILKMSGAVKEPKSYAVLSTLHCVNFSDMDPALQAALPELIRMALGNVVLDFECVVQKRIINVTASSPESPLAKPGWFFGLLGGSRKS